MPLTKLTCKLSTVFSLARLCSACVAACVFVRWCSRFGTILVVTIAETKATRKEDMQNRSSCARQGCVVVIRRCGGLCHFYLLHIPDIRTIQTVDPFLHQHTTATADSAPSITTMGANGGELSLYCTKIESRRLTPISSSSLQVPLFLHTQNLQGFPHRPQTTRPMGVACSTPYPWWCLPSP